MTVKQISLITMKSGEKANLPDSLNEAEICFTTDTGEIFIGAPNFGPVQNRSDQSTSDGQGISPYRNIKILTEFDVSQTITGSYYTQGPLVSSVLPLTSDPYTVYTFDPGINSAVVSFSLYDGVNVNLVGDIYLCTFGGEVTVCMAGMRDPGVVFSGTINSNGQIVLLSTNTTASQYTIYLSAKCWQSSLAVWDGTKGDGISPTCYAGNGDGSGAGTYWLAKLKDVKLTGLEDKQFLQYNAADGLWENTTINYSDITGDIPEGESYLKDLLDVTLTSPTDDQFLYYNKSDDKWENKTISYSDISGTPSPSPALWTVMDNIGASGSTSGDATILDENYNIFIIRSANVVESNAIEGYTVSGESAAIAYYQNTGVEYTGPYTSNTNDVNITLMGGTGQGAVVSVNVGRTTSIQTATFNFVVSDISDIALCYIGGKPQTSIDEHGNTVINTIDDIYFQIQPNIYPMTMMSSTSTSATFNITSNGPYNITNQNYTGGQEFTVWKDTGTSAGFQNIGTVTINSFNYYNFIMSKNYLAHASLSASDVGMINGGSGYAVGDVIPIMLSGTPTSTNYATLTVTSVEVTPPSGVLLPATDTGQMVILSNKSSTGFYVYSNSGEINGSTSPYIVEQTDAEAKFVKSSDGSWAGF